MPTGNGKVKLFLLLTLRGIPERARYKKEFMQWKMAPKNHAQTSNQEKLVINTLASAKEFAEKN